MVEANRKWIYTYDYAPNQIWEPWRESDETSDWIAPEAERTVKRVANHKLPGSLTFALLTDNHYVINGTWQDTQAAIAQLHKSLKLDGIIHLGDFTDGMVRRELTHKYAGEVLGGFEKIGLHVYAALGNHDCNYFKNNPDRMSFGEQCKLYLKRESPRYFADYEQHKLRLIFIDSYDVDEQLRYGFSHECINWLDNTLGETLSDWSVIVFSHLPPLVQLQVWAKEIRNSDAIMTILNKHAAKILAFINGHNHCDHLYNDGQFPIISINCAKCEYFLEHKPEGAVVPYRELGEITQESFDIMTIDAKHKTLRCTRFGAGGDRIVENGKVRWL